MIESAHDVSNGGLFVLNKSNIITSEAMNTQLLWFNEFHKWQKNNFFSSLKNSILLLEKDEDIVLSNEQLKRVLDMYLDNGIDDGGQFSMGKFLVMKYGEKTKVQKLVFLK